MSDIYKGDESYTEEELSRGPLVDDELLRDELSGDDLAKSRIRDIKKKNLQAVKIVVFGGGGTSPVRLLSSGKVAETSKRRNVGTSKRRNVETSKRRNVETSKRRFASQDPTFSRPEQNFIFFGSEI